MIELLRKMRKAANAMPDRLETEYFNEINRQKGEIESINRETLHQGLTSNLLPIKPPYTPFTRRIKSRKGQPTNRVTLKDTGAFYKGIKATVPNKGLVIKGTEGKTQKLKSKYGNDIIGISQPDLADFIQQDIKPEMIKIVKRIWR